MTDVKKLAEEYFNQPYVFMGTEQEKLTKAIRYGYEARSREMKELTAQDRLNLVVVHGDIRDGVEKHSLRRVEMLYDMIQRLTQSTSESGK